MHRWKHNTGSNGGSSGGWGSSGGSSGGYSGGSSGGSSGGGVIYSEPAIETQKPMEGEAPAIEKQGGLDKNSEAMLTITLPDDAKVFVNGKPTRATGGDRHFISRGLVPGNVYTYEVKAIVERDGRDIEEVKTVKLAAGEVVEIAMEVAEIINPVTTLKVTVPEDATVTLAGHETSSTGEVRTFTSSTLAEGKFWKDYTIQVTHVKDGQTITLEKTITLKAGSDAHVEFDFDRNEAIADAR